ncbi:MAG TPA: hypothetical protein DHV16_09300 [Nitrospiraceae bacterium]|nr:MAG: hypothetical protein A2Z82_00980 [Nitrospirae bacterium GWA2_46_11]HAK88928.1 hypothetical protein [Nitrospiraceae bacterium]HCZ12425.1 hypothetical protein [Nitrospiraceae bacterium]
MIVSKHLINYQLSDTHHILINSLSGAVDVVEKDLADKLHNCERDPQVLFTQQELTVFQERGYLFDNTAEEKKAKDRIMQMIWKTMEEDEYINIALCPTLSCNFSCNYCFEKNVKKTDSFTLANIGHAFSCIAELKKIKNKKYVRIDLFGGEPLMPHMMPINEYIFKKSGSEEYKISILTNGYNIDTYLNLLNQNKSTVESIQVTLDGIADIHDRRRYTKNETGTFSKITDNVDRLLLNGFKVIIRTNIDFDNISKLEEYAEYIQKRWGNYTNLRCGIAPVTNYRGQNEKATVGKECDYVEPIFKSFDHCHALHKFNLGFFRILSHVVNIIENDEKENILPRYYFCQATGMEYYIISPDNNIYCCPEVIGVEKYSVGKLFPKLHLDEHKLASWRQRNILNIPECKDCLYGPLCGGGCSLQHFESSSANSCPNPQNTLFKYLEMRKDHIIKKYTV